MGHKERIKRYRDEGGAAALVRVEVLVPPDDRTHILAEAARLRAFHRAKAISGQRKGSRDHLIAALEPKYVWWPVEGTAAERRRRILAQIMNLGTYEDIRALEAAFDQIELADVMTHAQAGWFSPRSWEFWRGRLSLASEDTVPARPPRRTFDAKKVQAGT